MRSVIATALSPKALNKMADAFRADAQALVSRVKQKSGETIDAVAEITQPFIYKVLPDLLGVPLQGREHMYAFGNMVWATMGPMNELFHEAMKDTGPVIEWAEMCCNRENLAPDSLGMEMYLAADRGQLTQAEAKLMVGILLSAAADTTVMTMANAIRAFCEFPDQYQLLRSDPTLLRAAFDESLRWDSPSRMAGRIAVRDVEIDGIVIPQGRALRAHVCRRESRPAQVGRPGSLRHQAGQSRARGLGLRRARVRRPRAGAARGGGAAGSHRRARRAVRICG